MADPFIEKPPHEDDIRHDGEEFDPSIEPKKAKAWLNIEESEDASLARPLRQDRQAVRRLERPASLARENFDDGPT
jgi:hypothetical protein